MKYQWSIAPAQPVLGGVLSKQLHLSPLLAQCLLNRGLSEPESIQRFLEPRLRALADPFLLPNIRVAIDRLFVARTRQEKVVIFGDYDVDGVSATTLMTEVLGGLGWNVEHYLPHRLDEGYGLSQSGVENCRQRFGMSLLLAVDCGSTATSQVAWLGEQGVDVLILDHHQIATPPPQAVALVNPQLSPAGPGSFHELCSAGLAFKLAHALLKHGRELGLHDFAEYDLRPHLDLVALGTIADLVPVSGENRILVNAGLERLNQTQRPGLLALMEMAGITGRISGFEVAYQLAPRLNAAGRLETAEDAIRLLLAENFDEARPLAQRLDATNRERQQIERGMFEQVAAGVRARFNPETDLVIVEGELLWHIGVVGIVASRLLQEFYRPTIVFGGDDKLWRGSGRSVDGFDLAAALRECDDLLVRHGGHAMAAGLTIEPDNLPALRVRLNEIARRQLRPDQLRPTLRLDSEVALREIDLDSLAELDRLQHTGIGNPPVHLCSLNLSHARPLQRIGAERKHAKLWVTDGRVVHEALLWNVGDGPLPVGRFDLAYHPQINDFNGRQHVQLKVLDWRPAAS